MIVLEEEAGIGKSRLIEFLIAKAAEHDFRVFSGAGSAIEDSTPYFGWRSILRDALGLSDVPQNPGAIRRHVLRLFRVESLTMSDAPLLNDVLQLQLPHNPKPGSASDEVRARHTRALLVDLVEGAKAADPLVIIIDDCQWLDSASWALLGDAVHRLPGTLFVVATRPITAPGPEELSQIKVGARHVLLDGLSAEATLQMVESDLGVNGLPESVETLVIERAGGHPFFSEEIALSLVDVGVITIDGHNAALGADPADLNRIVPPGTVQNVVTSRIDQLDAGAQFVLRIASVIGRTFDADLLTAVYPIADDREEVTRHLLVLEERGLIRREEGASGEVLAFRHAITRDVAYESILYSQRRHLHRAVAAELEASYEDHRGLEPILAHHWERAAGDGTDDGEALHKAEGYLTESGLGALRHGAFIEARDFLKRALAVQERAPEGNDSLRTLEILKHLGTATFATSGYGASETRAIFERAYAMAEGRVSPSEMFPTSGVSGSRPTFHRPPRKPSGLENGSWKSQKARTTMSFGFRPITRCGRRSPSSPTMNAPAAISMREHASGDLSGTNATVQNTAATTRDRVHGEPTHSLYGPRVIRTEPSLKASPVSGWLRTTTSADCPPCWRWLLCTARGATSTPLMPRPKPIPRWLSSMDSKALPTGGRFSPGGSGAGVGMWPPESQPSSKPRPASRTSTPATWRCWSTSIFWMEGPTWALILSIASSKSSSARTSGVTSLSYIASVESCCSREEARDHRPQGNCFPEL